MLSVVCPVYNEAENIGQLFQELREKVLVPMEVLIVYDNEDDNTIPVVRELVANSPFEIRLVKNKLGPGPILKGLLSRAAGMSLHYIAGVPTHDITNSFKMYKRQLLETTNIESDAGFVLGMEIVIKSFLAGKRITELPCTWMGRVAGKSRFRMWKWLPKYLRWYVYALKRGLLFRDSKGVR